MSLCNILKDAAQVMKKASTLKTGKSKFRSGWYDHECYIHKKKAQRSLRHFGEDKIAYRVIHQSSGSHKYS